MSLWKDYRPSLRTVLLSLTGGIIIALIFYLTKPPRPDAITEYTLIQKGGPEAIAPYKPTPSIVQSLDSSNKAALPTGEREISAAERSAAYHAQFDKVNRQMWDYMQTEMKNEKKPKKYRR